MTYEHMTKHVIYIKKCPKCGENMLKIVQDGSPIVPLDVLKFSCECGYNE